MEEKTNGWVIVNMGHPRTKTSFISGYSFRHTRRQCVADFCDQSGSPWKYWRKKYNFRCVKATQTVTTTNQ